MNRTVAIVIFFLGCFLFAPDLLAQYETEKDASIPLENFYIKRERPGLRRFLSKFTFGFSTGFGRTTFKHDITGFDVLQPASGSPMIFSPSAASGYSNWFNKLTPVDPLPGGTTFQEDVSFKSKAFHIPLRATLHFEFQRFRIGGGYSFEYTHIGEFKPQSHSDEIQNFQHDATSFFLKKYFGLLGASVYRYEDYLLVVEANIGGYKLGKDFDMGVIDKSLFFNFGVAVEREMSEYFKLFVKPSYDFKSFTVNVPESGEGIRHRFNTFYINVGATYSIPELRKCFLKECKAQINHAHGNREYRSRVHPIHKKQNPHYGENYPTLIKYKGKNKKKLNPY